MPGTNQNSIYGDLNMYNQGTIKNAGKIWFNTTDHYISSVGPDLHIQGQSGIRLKTNDPTGGVWVNCAIFRPDNDQSTELGSSTFKWERLHTKDIRFADGTVQDTAGGGGLGVHQHSGSGDGGNSLTPLTLRISTSPTARFRLPVGNNMY